MKSSPTPYSSIRMLIVSVIMFIGSAAAFGNVHKLTKVEPSHKLYAKKPTMSGVGGLPGFKSSSKKPVTSKTAPTKKSTSNNTRVKQTSNAKPKKNGTSKNVFEQPKLSTDTPWSSILVAFLNPLRNPNSLFLYLLIIVSVLGKLNENK